MELVCSARRLIFRKLISLYLEEKLFAFFFFSFLINFRAASVLRTKLYYIRILELIHNRRFQSKLFQKNSIFYFIFDFSVKL